MGTWGGLSGGQEGRRGGDGRGRNFPQMNILLDVFDGRGALRGTPGAPHDGGEMLFPTFATSRGPLIDWGYSLIGQGAPTQNGWVVGTLTGLIRPIGQGKTPPSQGGNQELV